MGAPIPATLITGDGIGPEIAEATLAILHAVGAPFAWDVQEAGMSAFERTGDSLPAATLDSIRRTRLALKGPLGTPSGGGFRSATVRLREEFKLYANVRPAKTVIPGRFEDVDIFLVRENLEGMYAAKEFYMEVDGDPHAIGMATAYNTKKGISRSLRYAFKAAAEMGRKRVTIVHKANILKILSGIYLETAREVAKEYEGRLVVDDMIVDACAMNLVQRPERFDVIVTTNLFGDVLSDLIAGLVGGLGLVPGANIGDDAAIFEAVHGTAPDIAGKGIANPTALILASAMMLDHVGEQATATRIRNAVETTLLAGERTGDLGGSLGTAAFTDMVISKLG
jgi:isocitrate dehydrogenase (NAD+)